MVIDPGEIEITDEQVTLIETWLEANSKVVGWLDGYALGSSYIDLRAKAGSRADGRQAYVNLDHETARAVPELRGKYARNIREFLIARSDMMSTMAPR